MLWKLFIKLGNELRFQVADEHFNFVSKPQKESFIAILRLSPRRWVRVICHRLDMLLELSNRESLNTKALKELGEQASRSNLNLYDETNIIKHTCRDDVPVIFCSYTFLR